ncbi:MAG: alpha/beta hydrolase [Aquisalinus sp.]|nr:alpha/beta hydrolase [Aquisalinus sp.]
MTVHPKIICIAGFGDNASMYAPLSETILAAQYDIIPYNMPGFGAPRLENETTLAILANDLNDAAQKKGATIIIAHSVASIIAALAINAENSPLAHIVSLEGNLTAADAYFSGKAINYPSPELFLNDFLPSLAAKAAADPILSRYLSQIKTADPSALWELGQGAYRYSQEYIPGDALMRADKVTYIYNPENVPQASLQWLEDNPLERIILPAASHWPTLDQPHQLAEAIVSAL